jgi:Na+/phosphate symporter
MNWLLQLGTLFILLSTFVTPLVEFFDCWDALGIDNDTELAVFALIFALCLVLLVSKLISLLALLVGLVWARYSEQSDQSRAHTIDRASKIFVPLLSPIPLRI